MFHASVFLGFLFDPPKRRLFPPDYSCVIYQKTEPFSTLERTDSGGNGLLLCMELPAVFSDTEPYGSIQPVTQPELNYCY
jgi:hypothetical protein